MKRKLFFYMAGISLLMMLLSVILTLWVVYSRYDNTIAAELRHESALTVKGFENGGEAYLRDLKTVQTRVTWVAEDGTVLFDNKADIFQMDDHSNRVEIQEAFRFGTGSSSRYSDTISEKTLYYAALLSDGTVLRVSTSFPTIYSMLYEILPPILIVIVLLMFMIGVLSKKMAAGAVAPISNVDPEHIERADVYEEMSPLVMHITHQERKIKEQRRELRRHRQEFKAITENMSEGFLVVDTQTNILSYNSSAKRLLHIDEIQEYQTALIVNRSSAFRQVMEKALAGEHGEQLCQIDGHYYHLYASPVRQDEKVVGAVILMMDMTEHMEQENIRREFTANVSHELKTPLTSISGFAEIIAGGLVRTEDIPRFAGKIYEESKRLLDLVNDIMHLSRLDENISMPEKEAVDLYAMAETVAERLIPTAEKLNVKVNVKGDHASIQGVRPVVEEILHNLIENAIKYNVEGGQVQVQVTGDAAYVGVCVADTGIGIPTEHQNRVFERFYRVDKSHSREIGGTGLGLSIVKHGVLLHEGTISLESKVGAGTKIQVTFPR